MLPISIFFWVILGLLGGYIAAHKGYAPKWGILVGVVLGLPGLVLALCLPMTADARERAEVERQTQQELAYSRQTQPCPQCRRRNSVVARVCPQCHYRFNR